MRLAVRLVIKVGITLGLFIAIFWEFGGRVVTAPGDLCQAEDSTVFAQRVAGVLQPVEVGAACTLAQEGELVLQGVPGPRSFGFFGKRGDGIWVARDHCRGDVMEFAYTGEGKAGEPSLASLLDVCGEGGAGAQGLSLRLRGFKVVPADLSEIVAEAKGLDGKRFAFWLLLAILVKMVGILGNAWRWKLLLDGQGLGLSYSYLLGSYFVGRWFGIITPGTLGLDGYRLYDSIRATGRPVEATAVIFIDKVIGLVSLLSVVALVFPLGWTLLPIASPARVAAVLGVIVVVALGFFVLLLVPSLTGWVPPLVPIKRVRRFIAQAHEAATAYSDHRRHLLGAVGLASLGHFTTALMYWAILMGITADAPMGLVLFSAMLMTSATLVGPSVGGEGIREFVFVRLLAGRVVATQAFLFGHIGFWIEKVILSVPGGIIYALRPDAYQGRLTREDLERVKEDQG